MADWLRPVFARKTPNLSALPYAERQATPSIDESAEGDEVAVTTVTKMRSTSRVSSIMGGFRPNSPSVAMPDVFQGIKDPESTYHKPNSDQASSTPYLCLCLGDTSHATGIFGQGRMLTMAETLQVIMMNQSTMVPLPIEYNACILHVLEAYYDMRQLLNAQQDTIEELKQNHTKNVNDFEALATTWELKEGDYKCELKKLEVLLSKTQGGMEEVALARSKSRIHGSQRASDEIGRGINTIKQRHRSSNSENKTEDTPIHIPDSPTVGRRRHLRSKGSSFTQPQPEDMGGYGGDLGFGSTFESSTSGSNSSACAVEEGPTAGAALGLGIVIEKPLPNVPDPPAGEVGSTRGMSFSFKPGDDEDLLAQGEAREVAKRHDLEKHVRQRRHTVHNQQAEAPPTNTGETQRRPKVRSFLSELKSRTPTTLSPSLSPSPSPLPFLHRPNDLLIRGDSTSSVVTAVRDGSVGNSSVLGSQHGRPGLDRHASSSEAVTAAARAIAASNKKATARDQRQSRSEPLGQRVDSWEGSVNGKGRLTPTAATTTSTAASGSNSDEATTKRLENRLATL
ncbi:hypothetical protein LSUB1_G004470 [Lachnellula subtilissima]|uniref:Uncharacterized protein n=1 Tax=Lachnellula subtilissima TaxID=602034 RepID=A0A8H8RPS5_9HELO|nr:hypothetical protein LSUB1_G004470 [Lachnellula subtilissima]